MSQNYLIGAKCTHLDEPGLYKDYKRIMTWSEFVQAGYVNNEVTRLCIPTTDALTSAYVCPNLEEIYGERDSNPKIVCGATHTGYSEWGGLPASLFTTESDGTKYIKANQNSHYGLIEIPLGVDVTVDSDCVEIGAFCKKTGTIPSELTSTLTVPASVKHIGSTAFPNTPFRTVNITGNDELVIDYGNFGDNGVSALNKVESITVSKAQSINMGVYATYPVEDNKPNLTTVYLNAQTVNFNVSTSGDPRYCMRYLSRVNLGPDVTTFDTE